MTLLPLKSTEPNPQWVEDFIANPSVEGLRQIFTQPPLAHVGCMVSALIRCKDTHPEINIYLSQIDFLLRLKVYTKIFSPYDEVKIYDKK